MTKPIRGTDAAPFTEDQVADYLLGHPEFFERHSGVLARLRLPHQRGSAAVVLGNTISGNDGPGVLVRGGSHADLSGNAIDGNGSDGVVVTVNSDVQLGEQGGIFEPANESAVPNTGYGISCSLNSTLAGALGTLNGESGRRKLDSSCSNGPKIE